MPLQNIKKSQSTTQNRSNIMSLSDPYTLAKLPRVSGATERCKVSRTSDSEALHVGISGASISNYILKPSPKLIWSHSIPPSSVITALEDDEDRYIFGVFNKTKKIHSLQVVERLENDSKVVKEIEMESKILNIRALESGIIVITENFILGYDQDFEIQWRIKSLYKSIFSDFIEKDIILVVEHHEKKNNLNYKLISTTGTEVNSKIIESKDKFTDLKFTYSDGTLYQYHNNLITLLQLPHFQESKIIKLDELSINVQSGKDFSFQSPAQDRLLLSAGQEVYLINTNFNIVLSTTSSTKSKVEVLYTTKTKTKSSRASLFGVILGDNDISGLSITLDSNTLRDSLGKKTTNLQDESYKVVPSIFDIKDEDINVQAIIKSKDFDTALLEFLEAKNDYYTEDDKIVDSKFIKSIVFHIFKQDELPERALTYLLTHPLFPTIDGLLALLRSKPRLLRQAIVTANVSMKELNQELNLTENDEIFKDIITRLLEFPKDKLNFKDLDSFKIVERIISLDYGYELISLLIDASGVFTWGDDLIEKLQEVLNNKVEALDSASNTLAVIEQAELKHFKTVKKIPVYSIEKLTI